MRSRGRAWATLVQNFKGINLACFGGDKAGGEANKTAHGIRHALQPKSRLRVGGKKACGGASGQSFRALKVSGSQKTNGHGEDSADTPRGTKGKNIYVGDLCVWQRSRARAWCEGLRKEGKKRRFSEDFLVEGGKS